MDHFPKVGEVIVFNDGRKQLVVGETDGGRLLVDLHKTVEMSDHALGNSTDTWVATSLEKALKG